MEQAQRGLHDRGIVAAVALPPLRSQCMRTRIEIRRQAQAEAARALVQAGLQPVLQRRARDVVERVVDRLVGCHLAVRLQGGLRRCLQRHVQHRQHASPGGLQVDLVADRAGDLERRRLPWRGVSRVELAPAAAVEIPHHVGAEIASVRRWRRTVETDPHRRMVVGEQVGEIARCHAVAETGACLVLRRRAPQRRAQPRHQQEGQQGQRQGRRRQRQAGQQGARQAARQLSRFQRAQGGQRRQQAQRDHHGGDQALVEQQRSHQREAGEADAHADVARRLGFQQLQDQQADRQRRARRAAEDVAVLHDHRQRQQDQQRQLEPARHPAGLAPPLPPAPAQDQCQRDAEPPRQVRRMQAEHQRHGQTEQVERAGIDRPRAR